MTACVCILSREQDAVDDIQIFMPEPKAPVATEAPTATTEASNETPLSSAEVELDPEPMAEDPFAVDDDAFRPAKEGRISFFTRWSRNVLLWCNRLSFQ